MIAVAVGLAALLPVAASSADAFADWHVDARAPLSLPPALQTALVLGGVVLLGLTSVACIGNAAIRLWRARPPERAQLAWLLTAVTAAAVLLVVSPVEWIFLLAVAMIPVAVAVGVLRYGLLGIEVVLRPALLYGLLTLLVALAFGGVTAGLSAILPSGPAPTFVAAAVVAVGLVPAYVRIRRLVARIVDGPAADPLAAMGGVGRVVAGNDADPVAGVLRSLVAATGAPGVELRSPAGDSLARVGDPVGPNATETPVRSAGEHLGTLVVAAPRHGFTDSGRALVEVLVPQIAVVVRATALNAALEEARRRLLAATRAERSRLRRDLHDGLGPSLAGMALGLEATGTALRVDPDKAEQIVARMRTEVTGAVDEVRRILDDLRPADLDRLGLADALRAHAGAPTDGLTVEVTADPALDPVGGERLDPDVEAAAYRIALEAATNARRHAAATRCAVRLTADDDHLCIEVTDDGHGLPDARPSGIGLISMQHRAEALGGTFQLHSGAAGTTVLARLPRHLS